MHHHQHALAAARIHQIGIAEPGRGRRPRDRPPQASAPLLRRTDCRSFAAPLKPPTPNAHSVRPLHLLVRIRQQSRRHDARSADHLLRPPRHLSLPRALPRADSASCPGSAADCSRPSLLGSRILWCSSSVPSRLGGFHLQRRPPSPQGADARN